MTCVNLGTKMVTRINQKLKLRFGGLIFKDMTRIE